MPKNYSQEDIKKALAAIKEGMSIKAAGKQFGIPKTTLLYKHKGIYPIDARKGPKTVLTIDEEKELVEWILYISQRGFPVTRTQLFDSVQILIKSMGRENPFTNGRPGRSWYESFFRRHPELTDRIAQSMAYGKSSPTEEGIRMWFSEVARYLQEKDLLCVKPSRVFSCDEVAFVLNPKGDKVMINKQDRNINLCGNDKECLTVLFMVNAIGDVPPPMITFSYQKVPPTIAESVPKNWGIGTSEDGWMTGESFYEYICNCFYPWLVKNNAKFPIVLFVDGYKSHLTMALTNFCRQAEIEIIALYPNASQILHPLDAAVFHPLKTAWKEVISDWKLNHDGTRIGKDAFASVLKTAIDSVNFSEIAPVSFQACGLHPFTVEAINLRLIKDNKNMNSQLLPSAMSLNFYDDFDQTRNSLEHYMPRNRLEGYVDDYKRSLQHLEENIPEDTLSGFKQVERHQVWFGDVKDENLFYVWMKMRRLAGVSGDSMESETEPQNELEPQIMITEGVNDVNDA